MCAMLMLGISETVIGAINLPMYFNMMVGMGQVRRKCLPAFFAATMLFAAGYLLVVYFLDI